MPKNKKIALIIVIILQILVLAGIILFKNSILSNGTEIFLRIEPVDPKDPLRGDYMTFKFTDLSKMSFSNNSKEHFKNGDVIYVPISEYEYNYWGRDFSSYGNFYFPNKKPNSGVFLKGIVKEVENRDEIRDYSNDSFGTEFGDLNVEYGIEDYFIPEGSGRDWFVRADGEDDYARVIVDADGNAVLKEIYIDGKSL